MDVEAIDLTGNGIHFLDMIQALLDFSSTILTIDFLICGRSNCNRVFGSAEYIDTASYALVNCHLFIPSCGRIRKLIQMSTYFL